MKMPCVTTTESSTFPYAPLGANIMFTSSEESPSQLSGYCKANAPSRDRNSWNDEEGGSGLVAGLLSFGSRGPTRGGSDEALSAAVPVSLPLTCSNSSVSRVGLALTGSEGIADITVW